MNEVIDKQDGASTDLDVTFRTYAWDYFALHADHRLRAFNFYIVLCAVIIGAFATIMKGQLSLKPSFCIFPLLLFLISFIFWRMDERARMLVRNGEQALKYLDCMMLGMDFNQGVNGFESHQPDSKCLNLFLQDDQNVAELKRKSCCRILVYSSYTSVFNSVFVIFGSIGLVVFTFCLI